MVASSGVDLPETMQSIGLDAPGGPEVLRLQTSPVPRLRPDDVLGRLAKQAGTLRSTIERARVRTRAVGRKLRAMEAIDAAVASRVLLIAGRPLNEPIAQVGPFVMNTQQEIFEAVQDFQAGRLG